MQDIGSACHGQRLLFIVVLSGESRVIRFPDGPGVGLVIDLLGRFPKELPGRTPHEADGSGVKEGVPTIRAFHEDCVEGIVGDGAQRSLAVPQRLLRTLRVRDVDEEADNADGAAADAERSHDVVKRPRLAAAVFHLTSDDVSGESAPVGGPPRRHVLGSGVALLRTFSELNAPVPSDCRVVHEQSSVAVACPHSEGGCIERRLEGGQERGEGR